MHKSLGWSAFGALLISTFAWAATSSATPDFKLYVGNSRGDDISIIDMVSLKVIGQIKAGEGVHGVCVQADGQRLFVTVERPYPEDHRHRNQPNYRDRQSVGASQSVRCDAGRKIRGGPDPRWGPCGRGGCHTAENREDATDQGTAQRSQYWEQPLHLREFDGLA